jgi:hypothetical protein
MDQYTRRIIGFGIHAGVVDGLALCQMFNRAMRWQTVPKYLSSDHDPLYRFRQWQANLRVLGVTEVKTVPYMPLGHPFVERLIGHNSSGIPRPRSILDSSGSRIEPVCLPDLFQQLPNSSGVEGADSDRLGRIQRSQVQILSLAAALSRPVRNTNGGVNMNSRHDVHDRPRSAFAEPKLQGRGGGIGDPTMDRNRADRSRGATNWAGCLSERAMPALRRR